MRKDRLFRGFLMVVLLAGLFGRGATVMAGVLSENEICDAKVDYFLGVEDYPETAKLHRLLIAAHPNDALAHYHLGFAYGMLGRHGEELAEYRQAASLGLKQWDLFLNLGLVYLEDGNSDAAIDALTTAVALGPDHPEGHFNLGLAYERHGMLTEARQEMLISLRLDPNQAEAATCWVSSTPRIEITYLLVKYGPTLPGLGSSRPAPTWRFSIMRMAPQVLGYHAALRSFVRRCRSNITSSVLQTCFMVRANGGGV
jgi:tetratricopeptide (TPR) repeat protein